MPFEPQLLPAITGDVDSLVVLDPGFAPNTIIPRDQGCTVRINWHMNGLLALGLGGSWTVSAFLESIGPGIDRQFSVNVSLSAGTIVAPNRKDFQADVPVPAGVNAGIYKLVVAVTYTEPGGTAGPLAAYQEGAMLQFFEP